MLSLTCKTAIKSVIYLASKYESGEKSGIKEIAIYINANEHTIGKMMQTLVKNKLINSNKGPKGGFYLSSRQLKIPIDKIIESIDGKDVFRKCALGFTKCSDSHPCPFHNDFKIIREQFEQLSRNKKVADFCEPLHNGIAFLIG